MTEVQTTQYEGMPEGHKPSNVMGNPPMNAEDPPTPSQPESYKDAIIDQVKGHLQRNLDEFKWHTQSLETLREQQTEITQTLTDLGVPDHEIAAILMTGNRTGKTHEEHEAEAEEDEPERLRPDEAAVRDWIKTQGEDQAWLISQIMTELGLPKTTAHRWVHHFLDKKIIMQLKEGAGARRYVYVKPTFAEGPKEHPHEPETLPAVTQQRGGQVAGTGRNPNGYPDHVRRVKSMLKPQVVICRKGNGHIHFEMGKGKNKKFTWTSSSPQDRDAEYDQLIRRLTNEGMLK